MHHLKAENSNVCTFYDDMSFVSDFFFHKNCAQLAWKENTFWNEVISNHRSELKWDILNFILGNTMT